MAAVRLFTQNMGDPFPARRRSLVTWGARFFTILLAALAGSFVLWDPLILDEESHLQRITEHSARAVRAGLAAAMRARLLTQIRLSRLLKPGHPVPTEALEVAQLSLEYEPGTIAVEWIDRNGELRATLARDRDAKWLVPLSTGLTSPILRAEVLAGRPHLA